MRFQDDEELDGNKGDLGPGRIAVPKSTIWCRDGDFFFVQE
ncbi:hypothetical protein [Paenibacillus lactis]|nr:hypothetical protein [Paenibacillus lactis]